MALRDFVRFADRVCLQKGQDARANRAGAGRLDYRPNSQAAENLICMSSGWDDGAYPSFFGFDAQGRPVMLVTDFLAAGEA